MFFGIRAKFLATFIISIAITLLVAIFLSYVSIEAVYMRINERNINAEFGQISSEIEMLLTETETLLVSRIINSDAAGSLAGYRKISVSDLSYAIQDLSKEVANITNNFQSIDSIYIYVVDEYFLAMSSTNTRRFYDADLDWPSSRIMGLLSEADTSAAIAGYVKDEDFPLDMKEPAYLMLYKKGFHRNGESCYCVNIKESAIFGKYSGFIEDGMRSIRILDSTGVIVSSADKMEIGKPFQLLEGENLAKAGVVNDQGMVTNYMPLEEFGLVIVSSIPTSIYTKDLAAIRNELILVFVLGMLIVSTFFSYWITQKLKPIGELRLGMKSAGQGDYSKQLTVHGTDELAELTRNYNAMLVDLQRLTDRRAQIEEELRERELAALRNEINPHFLYNTLNTVKCMAEIEGDMEVARCIVALGGIIAPLYKHRYPMWTLEEELEVTAKYLDIMNIRYGNGITYTTNVPDEILKMQTMKFILQPIIENSIMHGFAERAYAGRVVLTAEVKESCLWIMIDDDGIGMTDVELAQFNALLKTGGETEGVGMMNVNRRIVLRYGLQHSILLLHSEYGGLRTCIILPN